MLILCLTLAIAQPSTQAVGASPGIESSQQCQSCHPRHFDEWLGGVHAFARRDFVLPAGTHAPKYSKNGTFEDRNCSSCHGGNIDSLLGEKPLAHPVRLEHAAERTITCTVCHQMTEPIDLAAHSPDNCDPRSPEERLTDVRFHGNTKPVEELRGAEFCGPCHEVTAPNGLKIERTFSQFLESDYPQRRISCVTCHMQSYGGTMVPGGDFREQVHRHDIIGTDTFANAVPALGSQKERVARFLSSAATMFVEVPEVAYAGESFFVDVEVVNSGAGHNYPVGPPGERRLWLSVEADGKSRLRTQADGDSWHVDGRVIEMYDRYLNRGGKPTTFWWNAVRVEERSLRPLERRKSRVEVYVPTTEVGKTLNVAVHLRFQACSPDKLRETGLETLIKEYPVFDVQSFESDPIAIRERARSNTTVRVPQDAEDLQEALRRVEPGGTVLVDPGSYSGPLDFHGKNVSVVAVGGPEVTTIAHSNAFVSSSVVTFRSGENRSARLEGFTVQGGSGTSSGNVEPSNGGGIYCHGASPTLRGNRIIANKVTGKGGGAYFLDSNALVEDNEIEQNEAGVDGGGIAIEGSSRVELRGNLIFANRSAGRGGGIATTGGLDLRSSLLQANQAARGGGLSVHVPESGGNDAIVQLREAHVFGNAAPIGGGVALGGRDARFEHVLIAGNAARFGGGVYVKGDGKPLFLNVTLTENRSSSGGPIRIRGSAEPEVRNAILFNNQPPDVVGNVSYSLVEGESITGEANVTGLPFFTRPGEWVECDSVDQPGCVPMRWTKKRPWEPLAYAYFIPGLYSVVTGSPVINAGSRADPADPDGSPRDAGAIHHTLPSKGFVRGDVDGDRTVTMADVVALGSHLFDETPLACADVGDVDDNGQVTPVDAYFLTAFCFGLRRGPAQPFPSCGVDPTLDDGLGCFEAASGCE